MKVIITGTTGMVGEGVLIECLSNPQITKVLSVSRKPTGKSHQKLEEYIVPNFLSLKEDDKKLKGYDACFFCAGVSSIGKTEEEYRKITYDTTLHFAKTLNPNPEMSFIYVSGGGTDSTEKGRMAWARIKGKTENDLMKLPFKQAFAFRPGFIKAVAGQQNLIPAYKFISWLYPVLKIIPGAANTMQQLAKAMIYAIQNGYEKNVVEVKDISILSERAAK
jgi:uncharacterized protein YbjT (DUF2867 family)